MHAGLHTASGQFEASGFPEGLSAGIRLPHDF
jgi:hypothetical protein